MAASPSQLDPFPARDLRLKVAGKFLRGSDGAKRTLRGVSYGPFKPNARGEPYPEDQRLQADLEHLVGLGFDTLRLYQPPSPRLLEEASRLGLRLIVGLAWTDHVDFLRSAVRRREILQTLREAVTRLADHPCVAAFWVGNEIESTLVRWMKPRRVQRFLERLMAEGRRCAPRALFSYATYPGTEYLMPRNADFLAVNVYLEQRDALAAYLQRLQNQAGNKPLVISEFGLDVARHGEVAQAETRVWFEQCCQRAAVAGTVWFSYTDEWHRGGMAVKEWQFGLVDSTRRERLAARVSGTAQSEVGPGPRISVIVCTYNGSATLRACLESLQTLRYPNHEQIVVDDGSTQDIAGIVRDFPSVRYLRQSHAGLSAARNLGAAHAQGEIVAYTDDDCWVDEDWLNHLAAGFEDETWVACGGPNIPPPPRGPTEAIVAAAPGAPAQVLLTDIEAEHLPGCNLAIRRSALLAIGGFHEVYQVAGDDVDVCWRLREAGGRLRFVPGAMVWHHRRYSLTAYFRQQRGYGHAEALLMKEHPDRFGPTGGARWCGAIYGDLPPSAVPMEGRIFHGPMGQGLFQGIYQATWRSPLDVFSGVMWGLAWILALLLQQGQIAMAMLMLSWLATFCRWHQLVPPPYGLTVLGQFTLFLLCWWQPLLREGARWRGMLLLGARPSWKPSFSDVLTRPRKRHVALPLGEWAFWSETGLSRESLLKQLRLQAQDQGVSVKIDDGWQGYDLALGRFMPTSCLSMTEYHGAEHCLTRVKASLLLSWGALLVLLMVLFLGWCLGVGTFSGCLGLVVLILLRQRLAFGRRLRLAAHVAGLQPMPSEAGSRHCA